VIGLRAACGAVLVAVLVCDLTFDLPVRRAKNGDPSECARALDAATAYYRQITTRGSPLSTAVAVVMFVLIASLGRELVSTTHADLARFAARAVLAAAPITLALSRTFPKARRLGTGLGDAAARTDLACEIASDHLLALPAMLAYVTLELGRL
jgi:hypothetical protein